MEINMKNNNKLGYLYNYKEIVLDAYERNPKADMICFYVVKMCKIELQSPLC